MKRKTEYVETMIKKSVINCIVIECLLSVVILFCVLVPLFSDGLLLEGKKACIGYTILTITMLIFIIFHGKFYNAAVYPVRMCHDTYIHWLFVLETAKDKGNITEEERMILEKKIKTIFDWFIIYFNFFRFFYILELIIFSLSIGTIILKILLVHSLVYSSFYGIITFLIILQYLWLYIISRHLLNSYNAWFENKCNYILR